MVGTLEQLYKAPEVLIDSLAICTQDGLDLVLAMVGDGKERPGLEARARALGLGSRVHFLGQLPAGKAVRSELDRADLFVLPSRQEGLPRAIIEAMARGLPCIGSTVGGIPELLPPEDMVPPGNARALAHKLREVVTDPSRMARMSNRNLEKAREYREDALRERRVAFYRYIRNQTETWVRTLGKVSVASSPDRVCRP
jgi:glycosyltransferase involved in cell wall biosynthesis